MDWIPKTFTSPKRPNKITTDPSINHHSINALIYLPHTPLLSASKIPCRCL